MADEPLNRLPPAQRYMRDPVFHELVDVLEAVLHRAAMTPTEIREAAMLAAIRYEERKLANVHDVGPLTRAEWDRLTGIVRNENDYK